jgi:hypothetical protein
MHVEKLVWHKRRHSTLLPLSDLILIALLCCVVTCHPHVKRRWLFLSCAVRVYNFVELTTYVYRLLLSASPVLEDSLTWHINTLYTHVVLVTLMLWISDLCYSLNVYTLYTHKKCLVVTNRYTHKQRSFLVGPTLFRSTFIEPAMMLLFSLTWLHYTTLILFFN